MTFTSIGAAYTPCLGLFPTINLLSTLLYVRAYLRVGKRTNCTPTLSAQKYDSRTILIFHEVAVALSLFAYGAVFSLISFSFRTCSPYTCAKLDHALTNHIIRFFVSHTCVFSKIDILIYTAYKDIVRSLLYVVAPAKQDNAVPFCIVQCCTYIRCPCEQKEEPVHEQLYSTYILDSPGSRCVHMCVRPLRLRSTPVFPQIQYPSTRVVVLLYLLN